MQLFCDESGGSDPASDTFLIAAVSISGAKATRLLKSFRKALHRTEVEIKGHALRYEQRQIFFDLIARETSFGSIVVSCQRSEVLGGWAMSALSEITLYCRLLCEACAAAAGSSIEPLTITVDGGRYKRADLRNIEISLAHSAQNWTIGRRGTTVSFRDSASIPGLQIADVIANTAFQSLRRTPAADYGKRLLHPLQVSGRLVVRPIVLAGHRPAWLTIG